MNPSKSEEYSFPIASISCPVLQRNSPARCVIAFLPSPSHDPGSEDWLFECLDDFVLPRDGKEDSSDLKIMTIT